jgi:ribose transport system ATP-binding protein
MAQGVETFVPRLEMRGISKRFGATVALDNVSIAVGPGQVMALVGENGAGKSTLMKVLSGAIEPDSGEMHLEGRIYKPQNPLDAREAGVAMIYQELSLAPHLSVEENIVLGMEPHKWGFVRHSEMRRLAMESLAFFKHPEIKPDVKVGTLSVGAQQLVEIARAIAIGSTVLVLDEPTSSLNRDDVERLFELIGRIKQQGHSIVYISHFIEEVKQIAGSVSILRDGKSVGLATAASLTTEQIVAMMIGRQVEELYPKSQRKAGEMVLEIESLRGRVKPASASLTLRRGEVVGIAGLVGAGRTELLRTIFGLEPVAGGRIKVGTHTGPASPLKRWQQGVGLLSENRKEEGLAAALSIADNITLSKLNLFGRMGMIWPAAQIEAADKWIRKLGIRCLWAKQKVSDLSGGNQQKVAIARLLQHDVDVLLLDEPTRGIDVAAKATIYKLIDELAAGAGGAKPKAVLVISSYLPELMGICDRIAVMCRGVLGPARPVDEINEQKLMLEATGEEMAA